MANSDHRQAHIGCIGATIGINAGKRWVSPGWTICVAAIALANKIAGMVWVMMARGERYKEPVACGANEIAPGSRRDVKVGRANST